MRQVFILIASAIATTALVMASVGANAQVKPPARLEPLPEPPPAPIGIDSDPNSGRDIRVTPGANDRTEEFVIDGKRAVRVTTPNGAEYYLIEDLGDGTAAGQNPQDSRLRVPRWRIFSF